jgi:soluble lytic murein transglycosylase-like protein
VFFVSSKSAIACAGKRAIAFAIVCAAFPLATGAAAIYVDTSDDGTIVLSNVAENRRYRLLLGDEPRERGAAPVHAAARRPLDLGAKARFDGVVGQAAGAYGIDSALLHAVISVESGYNPAAVSPKGARGLMQLMPKTAQRYGVANSLDPAQNVDGGARYLRDLLKQFDSDLPLVLAAYNAGENAVVRHGNQIPPYRETANYVPKVLAYYEQYQAAGRR